jgi:hypothetical protein
MLRSWRPSERSRLTIVLALICCSPALAQSVSPDGSVISNDTGTLMTAAGTWSFGGPAPGRPGEWLILLNGSASNGGISADLEVANGGQIYALTAFGSWWIWQNGSWAQTPISPGSSPDGSFISNGTGALMTAAGAWSFGAPAPGRPGEWLILLNGSASNGGISTSLEVANGGQIYALTASGSWWIWNGSWTQTSAPPPPPQVGVLQVGPGRTYQTISSAVDVANADTDLTHNYDIQVLPGTYTNDFPAALTRPMTIEVDPCCTGQEVALNATVDLPNQKGILLSLSSLTVNGLTFEGAHISAALGGNGAGIRDQSEDPAAMLIIQNSLFTNNQEGVLTGDNANQVIMVSNSSFINNGNPDPSVFQHGIYVNAGAMFSVSDSLFCGQLIGHDVKSRAASTTVTGSTMYVGTNSGAPGGCNPGSTSNAIDMPNGGTGNIDMDQIFQGDGNQNGSMIRYGEEGLVSGFTNALTVTNTLFDNLGPTKSGIAIDELNNCSAPVVGVSTNTFTGNLTQVNPANCAAP